MKRILFAALAAVALIVPAHAQYNGLNVGNSVTQSGNVTTGSAQCVAAQSNIQTLFLFNNGSNTIWFRVNDGTAPSANAAGSIPIAQNTGWWWPYGTAPRNGLNCISPGGASALTVVTGQ